MKDKKTTNKVTQCEDGNPDCFHTPEPVEEERSSFILAPFMAYIWKLGAQSVTPGEWGACSALASEELRRVEKRLEKHIKSLLAQERERQKREMLSVLRRVMEDFEDGHYPSADVVDTVESLLKS